LSIKFLELLQAKNDIVLAMPFSDYSNPMVMHNYKANKNTDYQV
jgi:hypothetical protein